MSEKPKKPYQKPSLKVYGDIHALTGTSMTSGIKFDGISDFMILLKTH